MVATSEESGNRHCALLELAQEVTGIASEQECVTLIGALLKSGRVVLTGSFEGQILS